jgi:hypothetical protein
MPGSAVTVSRFRADGATHSDSGVLQDASDTAASIGNDHLAIADIGLTSRPLSVDAAQVAASVRVDSRRPLTIVRVPESITPRRFRARFAAADSSWKIEGLL